MPRGCARRPRPQSGCVSPENPGKSAAAQLIDGVTRQPIDAGEKAPGTASSDPSVPRRRSDRKVTRVPGRQRRGK